MRLILFVSLLFAGLGGCALLDPPSLDRTLVRGETYCTSGDGYESARLRAIAATLHTPEMEAAIAAARK